MNPHASVKTEIENLKQELLREIQQIVSEHITPSERRWIRSHEVKEMLNISENTLKTLRANDAIPYTKLHATYFYDRIKINQMLAEKASERQMRYDKFKIF